MDRYADALRDMAKKKTLEERLKITPEQYAIYEDIGMMGMGSVKDLRRGVTIPFPEGLDLKLRKASKDIPFEKAEIENLSSDPRLEKDFGEMSLNQAMHDRIILDQIREGKKLGQESRFSQEPSFYQSDYEHILKKLKGLLGE